jgi:hypothetical protein
MVRKDEGRLRALRRWISRCAADPRRLATASPVCGAWQLRFDVLLAEPALQRVVVECRGPGDAWRPLHARTIIEFRAEAAQPRTALRREFSVPVPGPGAELRIAVRGIGRLGITGVELTDGVTVLGARGWRAATRRVLGRRAPRTGFPDLDWARNEDAVALRFEHATQARKKSGPAKAGPLCN